MDPSISQVIVQMVSPAVMVSACGLMLLGLGNKYARVVDRIRLFAAEVRALRKLGTGATDADRLRMHTLEVQIPDLFRRGRLLRNSILHSYLAIMSFVVCSFMIPLTQSSLSLLLFCVGMACVLVAVVLAWRETTLSFRLLNLEVSTEKE
jgi:hypothetical protein